jgi:hypothetical protein
LNVVFNVNPPVALFLSRVRLAVFQRLAVLLQIVLGDSDAVRGYPLRPDLPRRNFAVNGFLANSEIFRDLAYC